MHNYVYGLNRKSDQPWAELHVFFNATNRLISQYNFTFLMPEWNLLLLLQTLE
jgi:hypothetical protein